MATAALVVGANLPDVDVVFALFGDQTAYLVHHRGISHSLPGLLGLAVLQAGVLRLIGAWRRSGRSVSPVRFDRLFWVSLAGLASHFLLDYTNSYGIRPWLPFSDRWYYGDIVFIVDPWLWLMLGGPCVWLTLRRPWHGVGYGLLALVLTGLIFTFGAGALPLTVKLLWATGLTGIALVWWRYGHRCGDRVALAALALMGVYWGGLKALNTVGMNRIHEEVGRYIPAGAIRQVGVIPQPVNPFQWLAVVETDTLFYTARIDLLENPVLKRMPHAVAKHLDHPLVRSALRTEPGRSMRLFARYLVAEVEREGRGTVVILRDVRFNPSGLRGFAVVAVPVQEMTE
jgi:inner membrane protein